MDGIPAERLGVKAHWSDVDVVAEVARALGARTLELHLRPPDLTRDRERTRAAFAGREGEFRLVVHQPEWVEADGLHLFVDPASTDPAVRRASEDAWAAAAALAADIGAAGLIVHPGGVRTADRPPTGSVDALAASLRGLRGRAPGVPLWLENMPWFYGMRDGSTAESTLGRTPASLGPVDAFVDGYCLDFCHAFLGSPPPAGGWSDVDAFLDAWGPRVRHAHVSGARRRPRDHPNPRDGEGIPLHDGDMDGARYATRLARLPPGAAVVPEIEGGFRDGARGFRDALLWLRAGGRRGP